MMTRPVARHCVVSGRVQGVFYRASSREQALADGLTGWVRNLPDGRVELVVCGEPARVDRFCRWLRQGPPGARVAEVVCENVTPEDFTGFSIRG